MPAPDNSRLNNILATVPGAEGELLRERQAVTSQTAADVAAGNQQRQGVLQQMRDQQFPPAPHLQNVAGAPPQMSPIEPLKAFQNPGVVLAMFGSLLTRAPLTAAFKAGGAAMKAYSEGNMQQYEMQRQQWKDNLDAALRQNDIELQQYNAAIGKYNGDMTKLTAEFQGIAAQNEDRFKLDSLQTGSIDLGISTLRHREDAGIKLKQLEAVNDIKQQNATLAGKRFDEQVRRDDAYIKSVDSLAKSRDANAQLTAQKIEVAKATLAQRKAENESSKLKNAAEIKEIDARIAHMGNQDAVAAAKLKSYRDYLGLQKDRMAQHDREFKVMSDRADKALNERIRDDKARTALVAGKAASKVAATVSELNGVINQINTLDEMVARDPSLVGLEGAAKRKTQNITGQSPINWNTYPQNTDFENKMNQLHTQLTKPFLNAHYFTANSDSAVTELVPGLDISHDAATVRSAFDNIRTLLKQKISDVEAQNTDYANAAQAAQVPPPPPDEPDMSTQSDDQLYQILQP